MLENARQKHPNGKTMKNQPVWRPLSSRSSAQAKPRYAIHRGAKPVRSHTRQFFCIEELDQASEMTLSETRRFHGALR
jgi:hypothetical protein